MMNILQTRLIHWKKQWVSLLFWLLFPIISTLLVIQLTNVIQDDSKVPVGIVLQEDTQLATALYDAIKETPLIRIHDLQEQEALTQLERHQLDSVFIIHDGYEENIRKGRRNHLITSYSSNLSFAYTPVKEMIVSFVQQDTGRSKAAYTVRDLGKTYGADQSWKWENVVAKSIDIQKEEDLLRTTFSFLDESQATTEHEVIQFKTWGLWALFSLLSTLLLFDWLMKENRSSILPRFAFTRFSFKRYLLKNTLWYTVLLMLFDVIAMITFRIAIHEPISLKLIAAILSYRIMLNAGAFVLATCFKHLYLYYSVSFALVLSLAISSGAVIPIDGIVNKASWLEYLNPIYPFLQMKVANIWLLLFAIWITSWYVRKEKFDA